MIIRAIVAIILFLHLSLQIEQPIPSKKNEPCRYIPGDPDWPDENEWSQLNSTVGGRLIATTPAASVCHGDTYNETACNNLKQIWDHPGVQ